MSALHRLSVYMCGLLLLVSCSPSPLPLGNSTAINNRPQWQRFIALIKLPMPPLLTTATVDATGPRVIDTAHRDELLAEQEQMIARLKALSSDIDVIFRYRFVLNGFAVVAPVHLRRQIDAVAGVSYLVNEQVFTPPEVLVDNDVSKQGDANFLSNSTKFIGAERVHNTLTMPGTAIPVRGAGIRVGIIDTGIDYLHKAFGGAGLVEDYKNNDPTIIEENSFPTSKVIAGIDLVGADYNTSSMNFAHHIPHGDPDPLDEGVHGTHVAGTVAGVSDGDNTHDGVAPDASLVAIKAFGHGSSGESVIIKALDYAIDPNGDYLLDDQVHVTSLSLGSDFGSPYSLYQEAIGNAVRGGTLVVVAAGNSGARPYVIGNPATADASIAVAASVSNSAANVMRPAVKFFAASGFGALVEAVVGRGKSMQQVGKLTVPLAYIGLADRDLSAAQKLQLQGKAALIDRGVVSFDAKIERAVAAGAVAVVMVNNRQGLPFRIYNTHRDDVPIVMVTQEIGATIKTKLAQEKVNVTFDESFVFAREDVIDTLARFSSHGPRGYDSAIKPEIAAPGVRILSAQAGGGDRGIRYSGTSMAAPHISGVVALMRQYRPILDSTLIKGMLLSNAKHLTRSDGVRYGVTKQGGGRVDAYAAVTAEVIFQPSTLSLGQTTVAHRKKITGSFRVANLSERDLRLAVRPQISAHLSFVLPSQIEIKGKAETRVDFTLKIDAEALTEFYTNLDGFIELHEGDRLVAKMPLLLGVQKLSRVASLSAVVAADSTDDAYHAVIDVELENRGARDGEVLMFELLGTDTRAQQHDDLQLRGDNTCDLQSAGYRLVTTKVKGKEITALQFAAKLYHPVTTWHACEIVVQFDHDADGIADQELVGRQAHWGQSASVLYDAHKMRALRMKYEKKGTAHQGYSSAKISSLPVMHYNHSTMLVVAAKLSKINKADNGALHIKLAAVRANSGTTVLADVVSPSGYFTSNRSTAAASMPILPTDDFLDHHIDSWQRITPTLDGMGFGQIPAHIVVPRGETTIVSLIKGGDPAAQLIAYFPHNAVTFSPLRTDRQSEVIALSYLRQE